MFSEIIDSYKSLVDLKNSKISYLLSQNNKLKKILLNLTSGDKKSDTQEFWVSEAKKCL